MAGDGMEGFPLSAEFLDELAGETKESAKEMLSSFTEASLWLSSVVNNEDHELHQDGHMFVALAHTMMDAVLRIAQIETAKQGNLGLDSDVVMAVGRSMFSALTVAGIRFGQRHPEAYGGTVTVESLDGLMGVIEQVLRGGEADAQDDE